VKTYTPYDFHDSFDSVVLRQVKKSRMNKEALKDLTYGGVMEILHNSRFYYRSSVGSQYSHLTDDGEKALIEYMKLMSFKMLEAEEAELDSRAKKMVLNTLKGETA
jgi:hypothetical protein